MITLLSYCFSTIIVTLPHRSQESQVRLHQENRELNYRLEDIFLHIDSDGTKETHD